MEPEKKEKRELVGLRSLDWIDTMRHNREAEKRLLPGFIPCQGTNTDKNRLMKFLLMYSSLAAKLTWIPIP